MFEIKHADLVVDHGEGFDDNWRVYVAAKQAWKAYLATLLEQIQSAEPLAGGKQRGHWKASIESYTQISAAIHRVGTEYYYELFDYGEKRSRKAAPAPTGSGSARKPYKRGGTSSLRILRTSKTRCQRRGSGRTTGTAQRTG